MVTFTAMISNILSTFLIYRYQTVPLWPIYGVTILYFVLTPLMGMIYFMYVISSLYSDRIQIKHLFWLALLPGMIYGVFALSNSRHELLFRLNMEEGYVRGPLLWITYLVFYFYCIACIIVTVYRRRQTDKSIYRILLMFPVIALMVIVVQQIYPDIILTGSAATCALLIIYLHFQNKQISQDYMTGAPNRQALFDMMEWTLTKHPEREFVLMVVSLRDFQQINNACGQPRGDRFLKEVCGFLCTVAPKGSVYRFSGDEFALLFTKVNEMEICRCIKAIEQRMEQPWQVDEYCYHLSVAIGITNYAEHQDTLESAISAIEYAISRAKENKENRICYCDYEMRGQIERRRRIIQILRDKLADQSFEMYYQPICSVKTGEFLYLESLMRIPDSSVGPIYPSEFIPIAEETGLIVELTYVILDKVCKLVNRLFAAGIAVTSCHVNFSGIQFSQQDLSERVLDIIYRNGTPASAIKIEFTESTLAESADVVTEFAIEMGKHGIEMGLDDFGIGYSNFATVIRIPFDMIKLDRSLVCAGALNQISELAIRNIVRTFHDLGMSVLAEGVETEEQREMMIDFGVDYIQGYYYARPLPETDLEEFLKKKQALP